MVELFYKSVRFDHRSIIVRNNTLEIPYIFRYSTYQHSNTLSTHALFAKVVNRNYRASVYTDIVFYFTCRLSLNFVLSIRDMEEV